MKRRIFQPEKHGMVTCLRCNGQGYIQAPERQCCPKCGGFGYVRKEGKKDANTSTNGDQFAEDKETERYFEREDI